MGSFASNDLVACPAVSVQPLSVRAEMIGDGRTDAEG
jgi:hypothetical protein